MTCTVLKLVFKPQINKCTTTFYSWLPERLPPQESQALRGGRIYLSPSLSEITSSYLTWLQSRSIPTARRVPRTSIPVSQVSQLCPPHWWVDMLFLLFPASTLRRRAWFPVISRKSIYPIFTKFGMGLNWVNSLHGIFW